MDSPVPDSPDRSSSNFHQIVDSFLSSEGLPFASVLPAERIREIFAKHDGLFAMNGIYNTVVVLWAFMGQVLRDGKQAACQSAVACIIAHCEITGKPVPTKDTGDYCVARAKLSEAALHELSNEVAEQLELQADESWLWMTLHPKLIDGFTFTMPDTAKNQEAYPQHSAQASGVGRLGKYDHVIVWTRPQCPSWMNAEDYVKIPETLELRELRFNIVIPGRRTRSLDIITTLTDGDTYTKQDIADLYGFRWNSESDIRSIKSSLNLEHVRCKSPEMVRRELWVTMLAYNLIRTTAASAAFLHNKQPRQISFTSTCQFVLSSFEVLGNGLLVPERLPCYMLSLLKQIAACEVGNRPGRIEPRVLKRRPKPYKLMQKPREVLRAELRAIPNGRIRPSGLGM